jgi:hypothetical protein
MFIGINARTRCSLAGKARSTGDGGSSEKAGGCFTSEGRHPCRPEPRSGSQAGKHWFAIRVEWDAPVMAQLPHSSLPTEKRVSHPFLAAVSRSLRSPHIARPAHLETRAVVLKGGNERL